MNTRMLVLCGLGAVAVFVAAGSGWLLSLPGVQAVAAPSPIGQEERAATLEALKPAHRKRPLVAIIGINDATETTDYLMPYGILRRADVADVVALATGPGPVHLFPALKVMPDATVAAFDAAHPDGADYVIVPAMSRDDDPAVTKWLQSQAAKGATIVGVCAGAKVVAAAGLLDGRHATTHWYYLKEMLKAHPTIRYVADRRMVVDGRVATTTGISASMPVSLTLVEAIAGREKAQMVAASLGLPNWDARHASKAFAFTRRFATTALGNTMAFWNHDRLALEIADGIDGVSLALVADAWSRTYRSQAFTVASSPAPVTSLAGLRIVPDRKADAWSGQVLEPVRAKPADALDGALRDIAGRYGGRTADLVSMQLEYPKRW